MTVPRAFCTRLIHFARSITVSVIAALVCLAAAALPSAAAPAESPDLAPIQALIAAGRYADAVHASRSALARIEKSQTPDSLALCSVLDLFSRALQERGAVPEARAACERALRIRRAQFGTQHPAYAQSLYSFGMFLFRNGAYRESIDSTEASLRIREKALGVNDLRIADNLLLLAAARSELGQHDVAKPMLERVLQIREHALGPDNTAVAEAANALAVLDARMGDYATPLLLYENARRIWQKKYGDKHLQVATCDHNMATLDYATGDYVRAETGFREAIRIRTAVFGPRHELVASSLVGQGMALERLDRWPEAREVYLRALATDERRFGTDSQEAAWVRLRIGFGLLRAGNRPAAKVQLERSMASLERRLGSEHPDVAEALLGLAVIAASDGESAASKGMFLRVLGIQERSLGLGHPEIGITLNCYAEALDRFGESEAAFDNALQAEDVGREHLRITSRALAETEALRYASRRPSGLAVALEVLSGHPGLRDSTRIARVWDAVIRSRSLVLDEVASRSRAIGASKDLAAPAHALDAARQRLANLLVREPASTFSEESRTLLASTREEVARLERFLAVRSAAYRDDQNRSRVGWREVEAATSDSCGLVSYVLSGEGDQRVYSALVYRPGNRPVVVPIGSADHVDAAITRWRRRASLNPGPSGSVRRRRERECWSAGLALRDMLLTPVLAAADNVGSLIIVPDGAIHWVNFLALPMDDSSYIAESGPLIQLLACERDLSNRQAHPAQGSGLLALGSAAYGGARPAVSAAAKRTNQTEAVANRGANRTPSSASDLEDFGSVRFQPLPETLREVREIAAAWTGPGPAEVLTGLEASESSFKALASGRRVLHLATHGFFLGSSRSGSSRDDRGIHTLGPRRTLPQRRAQPSPLHLSGLALAGANARDAAGASDDDGILTAEEIAALDLTSVDWAVLSACDTGMGEFRAREGVMGLRRAFQVAGARTVIMSLWAVEDRATRSFMFALYRARSGEPSPAAVAIRSACRAALSEERAQSGSGHPFFWAAFVAVGD